MAIPATEVSPPRGRPTPPLWRRLPRGPADQPSWVRPGLFALLVLTAALYLWDLSASGDGNSFYAAAAWAGTRSWKALFFGSLDPGNAITVDKPPAALWAMGLSGRIFGFNSWSMLVPQALEGVAAVALLYGAVRRWAGYPAGLLAGALLALTPVAAMMFRFNNPDALLVLLLVAACYCTVRATTKASWQWLVLAGVAVGTAFLAKMLQGYIVIPALALTYLVAAPTSTWRRIWHLLAAGAAVVASTGWFLAVVALWPAAARPYIGGSTDNSELQLALGYNGLGRIFGSGGGGSGGGGGGMGFGGPTGLLRMFGSTFGGEISWLLPTALLALVLLLWVRGRAHRTDRVRAAVLLWGGWLLVNGLIFSFMDGIIHPYYTVALAPPIAALVAIGATELWRERERLSRRAMLGALLAVTGVWTFVLLGRYDWQPWLRWFALVGTVAVAVALVTPVFRRRYVAAVLAAAALVTGGSATAAWSVATVGTPHTGSTPASGPSGFSSGGMPGGGSGGMPGGGGGFPGRQDGGAQSGPAAPGGQPPGMGGTSGTGSESAQSGAGGFTGGMGGMGGGSSNSALNALLKKTDSRWSAAVTGDQTAASLELASGTSVMSMGGWDGSDPYPSLAQFKEYVAKGEVRYFVAGGGMGGGMGRGGGQQISQIQSWVEGAYTSTTVGGQTVYDLTQPKS